MRSIEVVVDLVPAREGHDGTGLVLPALLLGRSRGARRGQLRLRLEARGDALRAEQLLHPSNLLAKAANSSSSL